MTEPAAPPIPHQPMPDADAPMPPMAQPPQTKASSGKKNLLWLVVLAVVLLGAYLIHGVINRATGDPDIAKVGGCMAGQTGASLKVVDCGPKAEWKVVGKVDDVKRPGTDDDVASICSKWPTTNASFWKGKNGGDGYVLCLEATK